MTELIYQLLQGKTKDALVFNVITILLYMDSYLQKKKKTRTACLLDNPLEAILALIWCAILLLTAKWIDAPAQSASILPWHNTNMKLLDFQQHYLPAHLTLTKILKHSWAVETAWSTLSHQVWFVSGCRSSGHLAGREEANTQIASRRTVFMLWKSNKQDSGFRDQESADFL